MSHRAGHFREVCQFGRVHLQCRCPGDGRRTVDVVCDRPGEHAPPVEFSVAPVTTLVVEGVVVAETDAEGRWQVPASEYPLAAMAEWVEGVERVLAAVDDYQAEWDTPAPDLGQRNRARTHLFDLYTEHQDRWKP